jgi:L-ribulose-5-phosphate 3-epimerase
MKPTFITDEATQEPSVFIKLAGQFSLDSLELRTVSGKHISDFGSSERHQLKSQLQDAGIGVCCIDSSVFKSDIDGEPETELDKLHRALDTAAYLNAPLIRIFTFWRREPRELYLERVSHALLAAGAIAEPYGIGLAIENGKRTMHSTGAELGVLMRHLNPNIFSVVWDPANSIFGGTDYHPVTGGYPNLAEFVSHVHLKDPRVNGDGRCEYVELGKGDFQLDLQLELLRSNGYRGYVSLETHWRPQRVLKNIELDYPGGDKFSESGYAATAASLCTLRAALQAVGA